MTEPQRAARLRAAALAGAAGVVLSLLGGLGGAVAAVSLWLAQSAFALAVSWARGTRALASQPRAIAQALPPLLAIWGVGLLALAALISWPLTALRDSGSLAAALALSVAVSAALLGLWRTWPLWGEVERDGGALAPRWHALATQELHAWRGLLAAALVLAVCTLVVALAWPGWLSGGLRWGLAIAASALLPAAHLLLQRTAAPLRS
ncbi:ankyrin, partial [Xanthomonas vesicatoria]